MGCGGKTLATVAGFTTLPGSEMVRTAEGDLSVTILEGAVLCVEAMFHYIERAVTPRGLRPAQLRAYALIARQTTERREVAKFSTEQAAAVLAVQQVINEWGDELDQNSGLKITQAKVLTDDVRYFVGGEWREGIAAVQAFYDGRREQLGESAPVMRHIHGNYRVSFPAPDHARVGFLLLFFAKAGTPPFVGYCDPLAVADVEMECRRDAEGDWKISLFNSGQIFRRG